MSSPDGDRYAVQRRLMIHKQLSARGIHDERVLQAMEDVPRHRFVLERNRDDAYGDGPLPIGHGQTISQPYMVAAMLQALGLKGDERVLEVGTGSGYQAALLGRLAREVFTIERIGPLVEGARRALDEIGADNVVVVEGDGSLGLPEHAPFDAIVVAAGMPRIHDSMKDQLADCGRLAAPVGDRDQQVLVLIRKEGDRLIETRTTPCIFVPLLGSGGWPVPPGDPHGSPKGDGPRRVFR